MVFFLSGIDIQYVWATCGYPPWVKERSALVNVRRNALSLLMSFTQGRTVFCFYITLRRYFKLEIIYESSSLFNLKEKKLMCRARGFEPMTEIATTPHLTATNH